jgi:hypothetical protein
VGDTVVDRMTRIEADPTDGDVVLDVCLNSEAVRVVNEVGEDVTPTDRPDLALLRVSFTYAGDELLIEQSETAKADGC